MRREAAGCAIRAGRPAGWPGLGQYLTVSLLNADMNAVLGATLVVGLIYMALNLLADAAYRLFDPRVS